MTSQAEMLRGMDAKLMAKFRSRGAADDAQYTRSTGGVSIQCKVYIDRSVILRGSQGQVISDGVTITAFAADIGTAPSPGARFVIGSETFTVDSLNNKDESRFVCIVKPGN